MIKIMVDSSADRRQDVDFMVPITVSIGGRDYRDGVDLDSDRFYQLLVASEEFPKTAQPSPEAFCSLFEQVKEAGDELLYFALSSTLSGTFQSANIAKNLVEYDGIYIIDTCGVTVSERRQVGSTIGAHVGPGLYGVMFVEK